MLRKAEMDISRRLMLGDVAMSSTSLVKFPQEKIIAAVIIGIKGLCKEAAEEKFEKYQNDLNKNKPTYVDGVFSALDERRYLTQVVLFSTSRDFVIEKSADVQWLKSCKDKGEILDLWHVKIKTEADEAREVLYEEYKVTKETASKYFTNLLEEAIEMGIRFRVCELTVFVIEYFWNNYSSIENEKAI